MPSVIDPDTMNVDNLPGIWAPVQWDLTEEERNAELEAQAQASLMWAIDSPEAILRLYLNETTIERTTDPPWGYDHEIQGEWDSAIVTFMFSRYFELVKTERRPNYLYVEYDIEDLGRWSMEIEPEKVRIERI